jgi:tetratricopeptide (TPR) repeat protein
MTDKRENGKGTTMNIPSVLKLIVAVFFLATLPAQVHALTPDQVFDKVKDSIVVVKTLDAQGKVKGQGSGVLLPSGKIATNCHVVEGGASYQVGRGEKLVTATLYAEDRDKDICLLDAKGITGKPAQLGKAASLKVGVPVYAVGAPMGLELSLSDGIVAQLRGGPPPLIQTTAAISPGSSGGGLFDEEGRLVGLTTLYIEGGQSLNFAMPVEWIDEIKPGREQAAEGRNYTEWLKRAIALEELKDWQGLLDWCQKWTKSEPKNAFAWYDLGVTYDYLKRNDDAIEAYCQALRINPEFADPWYNLGIAYSDLKRYDDAIEAYRQAIRINPEFADAWFNLGVTYSIFKQRYDDAIEAYHQALRINPEYADAWFKLGFAYRNLKRYDDAIEAYRQALRINPEHAMAWSLLGVTYSDLKRYDDAIEALRQALRINPENGDAWLFLGDAYYRAGNRTAALNAVRELRRLDPEKADMLFNVIVPR